MHVYIYIYIHIYIYTHIYTYIYTYIYICTAAQMQNAAAMRASSSKSSWSMLKKNFRFFSTKEQVPTTIPLSVVDILNNQRTTKFTV